MLGIDSGDRHACGTYGSILWRTIFDRRACFVFTMHWFIKSSTFYAAIESSRRPICSCLDRETDDFLFDQFLIKSFVIGSETSNQKPFPGLSSPPVAMTSRICYAVVKSKELKRKFVDVCREIKCQRMICCRHHSALMSSHAYQYKQQYNAIAQCHINSNATQSRIIKIENSLN